MVRSSSWRTLSSPGTPEVAVMGARFSLDRKNRFPFPPAPPNTARYSSPCSERSTTVFPSSFTTVPNGTFTSRITQARWGGRNMTTEYINEKRDLWSNAWTHRNVGWAAVTTITVLAATRLAVLSLIQRNYLCQGFDKPIGWKHANEQ